VSRTPKATIEGDLLTIENVRSFHYRSETDFDENWETRTYDLSKLRGVDMFFCFWDSPVIAHTIASWEFKDGPPLAISIETRKEIGESYSAILGFFRKFELYYVVSDERDVVTLRTNHRGEEVYLYRLKAPVSTARAVLLDYVRKIDELAASPSWYNAFTYNCTTQIHRHVQQVAPRNPFSWKILFNGYLPELGYERGTIDTSLSFEELRRASKCQQHHAARESGRVGPVLFEADPRGPARKATGPSLTGPTVTSLTAGRRGDEWARYRGTDSDDEKH